MKPVLPVNVGHFFFIMRVKKTYELRYRKVEFPLSLGRAHGHQCFLRAIVILAIILVTLVITPDKEYVFL